MNIRKLISAALAGAVVILAGCADGGDSNKNESTESQQQIEAAALKGREAAREFVNTDWLDTMELQRHLMDVRSRQSQYVMKGEKVSAAAFDSAFISTLRSVNPALYHHVQTLDTISK